MNSVYLGKKLECPPPHSMLRPVPQDSCGDESQNSYVGIDMYLVYTTVRAHR